jgi:Eco57I restriction endonuclease.
MPKGVTKQRFNKFKKYYDPEIFCAAGKRIRSMAKVADRLSIEERIERITAIFNTFRNPDKETVLTPWRVVNMHLGDCLGGYKFYDETNTHTIEEPAYIEHGEVTPNVFNPESRVLEINSKSGLYPLYVTYSIYRSRLAIEQNSCGVLSSEQKLALWDMTVKENVFVVCKTTMAKSITKRTLIGFRNAKVNTRYFEDLINQITNKPQHFIEKVKNGKTYWKVNDNENMKFNAIVGNPPYQVMDGGNNASAKPIYNYFVDIAKKIKPNYISMIMPAKWYNGGKGLDDFRTSMLNDTSMRKLVDYTNSNDCFKGVDIAGGICYFLWDKAYSGLCTVINNNNGRAIKQKRNLSEYKKFIRDSGALSIIKKVTNQEKVFFDTIVSSRKPFGLPTNIKPTEIGDIALRYSGGKGLYKRSLVVTGKNMVDKWKVITSRLTYDHAGRADKDGRKRIISTLEILSPSEICSETYLVINHFDSQKEALNLYNYFKTKFIRFLIAQLTSTQQLAKANFGLVPIQDFSKQWTDEELYHKYDLSSDEIAFIESMIKPME